jgi:hypothetical protein
LSWLRGIFARPDSKLSHKKRRLKTELVVQSGAKPESWVRRVYPFFKKIIKIDIILIKK